MRYEATLRASRRSMACVILTSTVHGKRLRSATGCCSLNLTMCCASRRSGRGSLQRVQPDSFRSPAPVFDLLSSTSKLVAIHSQPLADQLPSAIDETSEWKLLVNSTHACNATGMRQPIHVGAERRIRSVWLGVVGGGSLPANTSASPSMW